MVKGDVMAKKKIIRSAKKPMKASASSFKTVFVALDDHQQVVASASNAGTVIARARKKGIKVPTIVSVPAEGSVCVY